MSNLPVQNSIRILLINPKNEILLMCADDPTTTTPEGKYHGKFWFTPGGQIEPGESIQQTALRELQEETGISESDITLGPLVWYGQFELILCGKHTLLKQQFIVAKTNNTTLSLDNLTDYERKVILHSKWFSLDDIKNSPDPIYPVLLAQYLPDILNGTYPASPIEVDLAKYPA